VGIFDFFGVIFLGYVKDFHYLCTAITNHCALPAQNSNNQKLSIIYHSDKK